MSGCARHHSASGERSTSGVSGVTIGAKSMMVRAARKSGRDRAWSEIRRERRASSGDERVRRRRMAERRVSNLAARIKA